MNFAMVSPAQRHRELIAYPATERTRLRKTQMMRIRWAPTANQAGLFDDMPDMVAVTNATRFGEFKDALLAGKASLRGVGRTGESKRLRSSLPHINFTLWTPSPYPDDELNNERRRERPRRAVEYGRQVG